MLPAYVRVCIKAGFAPADALDYEACLQKRYEEVVATQGDIAARKWLKLEAISCLAAAGMRFARFFAFWSFN
jgi:hypothetical protein